MNRPQVLIVALSLFLLPFCKSEKKLSRQELLVGTWQFNGFELPESATPETKKIMDAASEDNKNVELSFEADGHFKSTYDSSNTGWNYELLSDSVKLVMMRDTSLIVHLDAQYLKLYRDEERPIAVFKRKRAVVN